jgi:PBP1b-binding outer membrane lipoprotein LpoB
MKKIFLVLIMSVMFLGGCGQASTETTQSKLEENTVTKVGTLSTKVGDEYLLNTGDEIVNITSKKIDLETYMKKPIKVTGMFSGSTLYVDKLEEQK